MTAVRKLYLAGPMRGYPEYNFPEFHAAAESLRIRGFEVWSPAERDEAEGFDPKNDEAQSIKHYMFYDLPAVMQSDAVAVLPGWADSAGARLEVFAAWTVGMPVFYAWSEAPIPEWSIQLQREHPSTFFSEEGTC